MKKILEIYKTTTIIISVISIYLSAAFISFEFVYLLTSAKIQLVYLYKPLLLSALILIISWFIKKYNPHRFTNTKVYGFLSIFLALSLSLFLISLIDRNFYKVVQEVTVSFERVEGIEFAKFFSYVGMGIFFLVAIPLAFLMELKEKVNKPLKIIIEIINGAICIFVLFIVYGYENNGWVTLFVNQYVIPFVKFLIGSLSLGWFYELCVGSMGNFFNTDTKRTIRKKYI